MRKLNQIFGCFDMHVKCSFCFLFISNFVSAALKGNEIPDRYVARKTNNGHVVGKLLKTKSFNGEVFLGVPYAEAPINDLRFKYPVAPKIWENPKLCVDFRPYCMQQRISFHFINTPVKTTSEDCLYLNIFLPFKTQNKPILHPVLVWIHGGSLEVGGANRFPLETTINSIVAENIVVVFVNYRLGPFGYLSLGNDTLPGNFGLEDQLFALKWVRDNIHWFDGNPEQVTLSGESAGASSASLLALSPKTKGLFRHLMLRSGSSLAPWAISTERTVKNSAELIRLSCNLADDKLILRCLQNVSADEIQRNFDALSSVFPFAKRVELSHYFLPYLTPTVDSFRANDSIIPDLPENLLKTVPSVPLVAGITSAEGYNFFRGICFQMGWINHFLDKEEDNYKFPYSNKEQTRFNWDVILPKALFRNPNYVYHAIEQKYFGNASIGSFSDKQKLKIITQALSDYLIAVHVMKEAQHYARNGLPVYFYKFEYPHSYLTTFLTWCADIRDYTSDAFHGIDLAIMFRSASLIGLQRTSHWWSADEQSISIILAKQVTNFVKYGTPTSENETYWKPFSEDHWMALNIKKDSQYMSSIDVGALDFWYETIELLEKFDSCKKPLK